MIWHRQSQIARTPCRKTRFWLGTSSLKSQSLAASNSPSHPEIAMWHCIALSPKSLAILYTRFQTCLYKLCFYLGGWFWGWVSPSWLLDITKDKKLHVLSVFSMRHAKQKDVSQISVESRSFISNEGLSREAVTVQEKAPGLRGFGSAEVCLRAWLKHIAIETHLGCSQRNPPSDKQRHQRVTAESIYVDAFGPGSIILPFLATQVIESAA